MSLNPAVCRICLAVDVRLLAIEGSLQFVYEKISTNALHTADGRPVAACYICYAQLNKCRKLMLTAARAENVLNDIFEMYSEITVESVSLADRSQIQGLRALTVSVAECFDTLPRAKAVVEIKQETEDDDSVEDAEDIPQPIGVTVSGIHIKDEDSSSDADDNIPLNSLRAETGVEGELLEDGACAQISGAEKQKQAEGNVTDRNQQPSGRRSRQQTGGECHVCQRSFASNSSLQRHVRTHNSEKLHECNVCHKMYTKSYLKVHFRTHNGEKPYECDVCHNRFAVQSHFKRHLRTHTGEKPHECNMCQKRFSRKSHLESHLRTHTGEKPYECNVCQNRFTYESILKIHLRTHTGEKPFECNVCRNRFTDQSGLKIHLRTHTGEKPYECNVCQYRFTQKSNLKTHLRTHTVDKL